MTAFGVAGVFLLKTARITTASESVRYTSLQSALASRTRNSWQRAPTMGIGLEWGIASAWPFGSNRSRYPTSVLAAPENGGVLISP